MAMTQNINQPETKKNVGIALKSVGIAHPTMCKWIFEGCLHACERRIEQ